MSASRSSHSLRSLVNGQPSELISIRDRGLQYGDGCFETIRIHHARMLLSELHLQRLLASCQKLEIELDSALLLTEIEQLLAAGPEEGVLKITVSRGAGGRGYSPAGLVNSTRILQVFDFPYADNSERERRGIKLMSCQHRLSNSRSLAGMKHLNRLDQVLASLEIKAPYDEGLCLDQNDYVIEASKSNLLVARAGQLLTPDLSSAGVSGVMLKYLIEKFEADGQNSETTQMKMDVVAGADELFLCNSVIGVWPVINLLEGDNVHSFPIGPLGRQAIHYTHELLGAA